MPPRPPNRRPYRPANPTDTALTTGLPVNPNGTYVANPHPTTAAAGSQGQYGAMLPPVQVQPNYDVETYQAQQANFNMFLRPIQSTFNRLTGNAPFWGATVANTSGSPDDRNKFVPPVTPVSFENYIESRRQTSNYNADQRGRGYVPSAAYGTPNNYITAQRGRGYDLFNRIAEHPEEFDQLPPAQQEAVKQAISGQSMGGTGGSDPLAGTPGHYYVDSTTEGSVGKVITLANGTHRRLLTDKNGRLYYGKVGQNRRGRAANRARIYAQERATQQAAAAVQSPQTTETTGGFTGSFGVVNFSTATG